MKKHEVTKTMTSMKTILRSSIALVAALTMSACATTPAPTSVSVSSSGATPPESTQPSSAASSVSDLSATPVADSFVISGGKDGDITINTSDITALTPITMEVAKKTSNGDSMVTVTGSDFDELLKKHGLSQKELTTIRLNAADGYSIELPQEMLATRQILLAYQVDGKPLTTEEAPIWVIVPEERAMYWAKNITTISLNAATQTKSTTGKVVLFETAVSTLTTADIDGEKAVSGKEVLDALKLAKQPEAIAVSAADGLEKSETYEILSKASILVTGSEAPKMTGADLPKGMQIKNVLAFSADGTSIVSLASCITASGKTEADGKSGVSIEAMLKAANMQDATTYLFTSADGYEKEIAAADVAAGIIYVNEEGKVTTFFNGLPKNTAVKDLLTITAK